MRPCGAQPRNSFIPPRHRPLTPKPPRRPPAVVVGAATKPDPPRGTLTVGGFLELWVDDPDLAGRVFLTEGKPIADALFRRWRLAVDEAEDAVQDGLLR